MSGCFRRGTAPRKTDGRNLGGGVIHGAMSRKLSNTRKTSSGLTSSSDGLSTPATSAISHAATSATIQATTIISVNTASSITVITFTVSFRWDRIRLIHGSWFIVAEDTSKPKGLESHRVRSFVRRLRRYLKIALLLAIVSEAAIRIYEETLDASVGSLGAHLVVGPDYWVLEPNLTPLMPERYGDIKYTTNADGFRARPWPKQSDSHRILFVGDSVTFGLGVNDEQIFSRAVEQQLVKTGVSNAQTRNISLFAYSPSQELAVLRDYGLKFKPDIVVLQLYMNDLETGDPPPGPVARALLEQVMIRSALLRRLRQAKGWFEYQLAHDYRRSHPGLLNDTEPLNRLAFLEQHADSESLSSFRYLKQIAAMVEDQGADLIVVLTPNEVQLFFDKFDGINLRFRDFCSKHEIQFYDPLEVLRASSRKKFLFQDGLHFSPEGHALLAKLIVPLVRMEP